MIYTLKIAKEYNHFVSAHFIVFDKEYRENLHGHNYYVEVEVTGSDLKNGKLIDVNSIKPVIKQICDELDHKFIYPKLNSILRYTINESEVEVWFNSERFIFPLNDIIFLEIDNSTMENLAQYIVSELRKRIDLSNMIKVSAIVQETNGQSAQYEHIIEDNDGQNFKR